MKDIVGDSYEDLIRIIKERADDFQELLISEEPLTLRAGNVDRTGIGCAILFLGGEKQVFGHQVGLMLMKDGTVQRLNLPVTILPRDQFVDRIKSHKSGVDHDTELD